MTPYGERDEKRYDSEARVTNRAAWNAMSCPSMSEEERATAAKLSGTTVADL